MPDPFEALRSPAPPTDPDPVFAARLRARMARALALPKGVTVSNLGLETLETSPAEPEPPAAADKTEPGVVAYLCVADTRRALDWYVEVLGARRRGEPIVMPDGRIGHAEIVLAGSPVYLADISPESHVTAPAPGEDARVTLVLSAPDVDTLAQRAVAAGAGLERPPADQPYGRNAVIRDPFGHRWMLISPVAAASPAPGSPDGELQQGDIAYVSLWVPNVERAQAFFGTVLGWTFGHGSSEEGRQVDSVTPRHGLWGSQGRPNLFLCFAVDDVDAAAQRVRDAGGRAGEPTDEPYGRLVNCADDQGVDFALFTPPPGAHVPRGPVNGARHGDVSYVTLEVPDSARTRAFYGHVLGWRYSPGRVADGWGIDGIVPMSGMQGGHGTATVVPMYRVDDLHAAVAAVRSAGGTATDPVAQPYGWTSECTDDQGTRFYLGEH